MKKYTLLLLVCIWLMIPLHSEIVPPTEGQTQIFYVLGQSFFEGYYPISATCQKIGSSYYLFTEDVRVNDISISPTDPDQLLIATSSGVYASYDAGVTWQFASGTNSGDDALGVDNNGAAYDEAVINIVHRAPIDAAFFMKDGQWWAGYEEGIYQTKDDGKSWTTKTRGLPSYTDPVDEVSVFPPFYRMTWDDGVPDFDANKDFWACSQGGIFYWKSREFIDMGVGLPQTVSDWNQLSVFDLVKSGDLAYIATELGLYTGTVNLDDEMVSWMPIGGADVTIDSSKWELAVSTDTAVTAYVSGVSQNTYVSVVDAAKSLYWRCKVMKSGGKMVIALEDENLYYSDDATFDPADLDYKTYDITAATVYQPSNISISRMHLADDGILYFVVENEIYKLNTDETIELVYDAGTGINDMVYHSDMMFIATSIGLFSAAMTDLTDWTLETGTLMEGSTMGDTVNFDVRSIEFDTNGKMYVGCHMGGLIRKETTGEWTNLNIGLGHRAVVPEKTDYVAQAFDSLNVQTVLEPWFGEVPDMDNDVKQYCLIVDLDDFYYLDAGDGTTFIDGYFDPVDQLAKSENPMSNEMDIIYIDSNPLDLLSTDAWAAVANAMTVEILQSKTVPEDEWVYRGLAELGELIVGLKDTSIEYKLDRNNSLLTVGDVNPEVKDYDYSFAFFDYLHCHYLTDAAKLLAYVDLEESGMEGIGMALENIDGPTVNEVFSDFVTAVYYDGFSYAGIPAKFQFPNLHVIPALVEPLGWGATENSDGPYLRKQTSWSFYFFKTVGMRSGFDKSPNFSRTVVFNGEAEGSFDFKIVLQNDTDYQQEILTFDDTNVGLLDVSGWFGSDGSEYQEMYFIVATHETPDIGGTSFCIFDKTEAAGEFSIGFNHNAGAPDYLNLFCYSDNQMYDDAGKAKLYDSDGNGSADLEGPVGTIVVDGDTAALALSQFYVDAGNSNYVYSLVIDISEMAVSGSNVLINLEAENINSVGSVASATGTLAKINGANSQNLVLEKAGVLFRDGSFRGTQTVTAFTSAGNLAKQVQSEMDLGDALSDILYVSESVKLEKPVTVNMQLKNTSDYEDAVPVVFLAQNGELKAIARADADKSGHISFETDELGSFQVFLAKKEVLDEIVSLVPDKFGLMQNFPNPFNSSTSIRYQIPRTADVQILIYDLMGRQIKTLYQGEQNAGYYTIEWNGLSDDNRLIPSGVYFYRMVSSDFQATEKMIYLK